MDRDREIGLKRVLKMEQQLCKELIGSGTMDYLRSHILILTVLKFRNTGVLLLCRKWYTVKIKACTIVPPAGY